MTSNYTQLLGFPWSEMKKYSKLVNYTAMGQCLPICFTKNSTSAACVSVYPKSWKKSIFKAIVQSIKMECLYPRQDKQPCLRLLDIAE